MSWRFPNKVRTEAVLRAIGRRPTSWGQIMDTVEKNEGPMTKHQLSKALRILRYRGMIRETRPGWWCVA